MTRRAERLQTSGAGRGSTSSIAGRKRQAEEHALPQLHAQQLPLYNVRKVSQRHCKKYNAAMTDYTVSFNPVGRNGPMIDMLPRVNGMFDNIVDEMIEGARDRDFVRVVFNAPRLDKPISMPFVRKDQLRHDAFSTKLQATLQSHEELSLDENCTFNVIHLTMPEGGKSSRRFVNINEKLLKMRSIIRIKNRGVDEMCCARAIVTGIARLEKDPDWGSIRQSYGKQADYARALHREANVPYGKCGLEEIKAFENTPQMRDYRVIVISKENLNTIVYSGPEDRDHAIYLYWHDEHFDLVTSLSAFYRRSYFCDKCLKGYDVKHEHKCENACNLCHGKHCSAPSQDETLRHCLRCNRNFKNDLCYRTHKETRVCWKYFKCTVCNVLCNVKLLQKHKTWHECGQTLCKICNKFVYPGHMCYMQPVKTTQNLDQSESEETGVGAEPHVDVDGVDDVEVPSHPPLGSKN
ncbi:uncharacterized protein [Diadema antillarum]|uniref:uncharacterized protein n=1 Tax=Diadema antillarum TaxID=105358 RepID=UPI003A887865